LKLSWNLSLKEEGLKEKEFEGGRNLKEEAIQRRREFKGGGSC
jgi:hypothetical protein